MKNIKKVVTNIKFNTTILGYLTGAYTVNTLYNVNIIDKNISFNNKNEFYATSLIYSILMLKFFYSNYKDSKKIENKDIREKVSKYLKTNR